MHMYCNRIRMDDILSALRLHTSVYSNSTSLLDGHWCRGYGMVRREQRDETPSLICQMSPLCLAPSSLQMTYDNTELMLRVQDQRTQIPAAKLSREASVKCIARISSAPKDATSVSSPGCTSGQLVRCAYFCGRVSTPSGFLKERKQKNHLLVVPVQPQLLHFRRSWCAWRFVLVTCWPWISADSPGRQPKWCFRGSWMVGGSRRQDETGVLSSLQLPHPIPDQASAKKSFTLSPKDKWAMPIAMKWAAYS